MWVQEDLLFKEVEFKRTKRVDLWYMWLVKRTEVEKRCVVHVFVVRKSEWNIR